MSRICEGCGKRLEEFDVNQDEAGDAFCNDCFRANKEAIKKSRTKVSGHARGVNTAAKKRSVDDPYEIWQGGGFEHRVLKKYQSPEQEAKNPYARWYCATKSPFTYGSWEYGDAYVSEIKSSAVRVK